MDEDDENLDKAIRGVEAARAAKAKATPKATPTLVEQNNKNINTPAGVKKDVTIQVHHQKLTKHGVKEKEEEKQIPHVDVEIEGHGGKRWKRKGAPPPPNITILRKLHMESGPPPKPSRRVSAHVT